MKKLDAKLQRICNELREMVVNIAQRDGVIITNIKVTTTILPDGTAQPVVNMQSVQLKGKK